MECGVCLRKYDDARHRPRNIQCGHTFCDFCLNTLFHGKRITCPECRFIQRDVDGVQSLPINHGVLEILDLTREGPKMSFATTNSFLPPQESSGNRSSSDSVTHLSNHDTLLKILRNIEVNVGLVEKMSESRQSAIESLTRESGACQQEQKVLSTTKEKLLVCRQQLDSDLIPEDFELPDFSVWPKSRYLGLCTQHRNLTAYVKANKENTEDIKRFSKRRNRHLNKLLGCLYEATNDLPGCEVDLDISNLFDDETINK